MSIVRGWVQEHGSRTPPIPLWPKAAWDSNPGPPLVVARGTHEAPIRLHSLQSVGVWGCGRVGKAQGSDDACDVAATTHCNLVTGICNNNKRLTPRRKHETQTPLAKAVEQVAARSALEALGVGCELLFLGGLIEPVTMAHSPKLCDQGAALHPRSRRSRWAKLPTCMCPLSKKSASVVGRARGEAWERERGGSCDLPSVYISDICLYSCLSRSVCLCA